ncbi:hypothetical protein ACRAWF_33765 [Streptomyces sp. L7]
MVEETPADQVTDRARHPYTRALFSATPGPVAPHRPHPADRSGAVGDAHRRAGARSVPAAGRRTRCARPSCRTFHPRRRRDIGTAATILWRRTFPLAIWSRQSLPKGAFHDLPRPADRCRTARLHAPDTGPRGGRPFTALLGSSTTWSGPGCTGCSCSARPRRRRI